MAFARPILLLLLIALPYFAYLGLPTGRYGRGRAWAALILRCLIVLLVVLSLAGIQSVHGGEELAVVFLVDVSDSVREPERERALAFVEESLSTMGPEDQAALVLFGADALVERPMMGGGKLGQVASIPHTHQTDLEGAIQTGVALFPSGAARRLVVLSDGRPTLGQPERAVQLAQAQGVQVDVVPLASKGDASAELVEAWLSKLSVPDQLHQGEEFTLSATVQATADVETTLTVLAGDRVVIQESLHLNPGPNAFAFPLVAGEPGFISFRASLTPAADVYPQNNALSAFALVEGPPRVLVVATELAESDSLRAALEAAGLQVEQSTPGALASDLAALARYAAVVLVDTSAQALSSRALAALRSYVRDLGGGLVTVGGPRAYGVGGWYDTPLEEALPVEMTIRDPQRFPPMSIVVVIDKSGSMAVQEGGVQKIRLAGEAAARVAELITDVDEITVIAFDDRPVDVIGPLPGTDREAVIDQVIRLQAGGGGIYVRESLQVALGYLADSDKSVRHILLLADGSDAEHQQGVPELVEQEMVDLENGITLSTVAIGAGQDLRFLEEIAALGNGRYHFTDRAADLPFIFAQETQLAMRSYVVEEPFYPQQVSLSPILTGIEAVPQLVGYVATTPKPAARVILATHQGDPLLAAWQYGLGRALAWTSDATGRWAQRWVAWEGFSRFWVQAVRWTIVERADVPVEVAVALEGEVALVTVDAMDENGDFLNGMQVSVNVVGPEGEAAQVELEQTGPGRYEGRFVPRLEGAYLMRLSGSRAGREPVALTTGWVMEYSPEYAALQGDPACMARLAEMGGGSVLGTPAQAFAHTLRGRGTTRNLWPFLLGLATLLLPFDVAVRRLALGRRDLRRARAWLAEHVPLHWLRPRPAFEPTPSGRGWKSRPPGEKGSAAAPSPVARLFRAKSRVEERRSVSPITPPPGGGEGTTVEPPPLAEHALSTPPRVQPAGSHPSSPPPVREETLARRLLRRRRERDDDEEDGGAKA
jgi:uncharacterized membrane protein